MSAVSIIIPTYKRNDLLEQCLEALENSFAGGRVPDEVQVIVSDDAAGLPSKESLSGKFDFVQWVQGPSSGPAANRNCGAAQAESDFLVFLDDDCLPESGWIQAYQEGRQHADVCEGMTLADREQMRFDEECPVNKTGGYLWSCNFGILKALFEKVGGFDASFPYAAMEDVDLHEKIKNEGVEVLFIPEAKVIHPWRRVSGTAMLKRRLRSHDFFWKKHPHLRPENRFTFFGYRWLRGLAKVTLPGLVRFRCRGLIFRLSNDIVFGCWTLKQLFR